MSVDPDPVKVFKETRSKVQAEFSRASKQFDEISAEIAKAPSVSTAEAIDLDILALKFAQAGLLCSQMAELARTTRAIAAAIEPPQKAN